MCKGLSADSCVRSGPLLIAILRGFLTSARTGASERSRRGEIRCVPTRVMSGAVCTTPCLSSPRRAYGTHEAKTKASEKLGKMFPSGPAATLTTTALLPRVDLLRQASAQDVAIMCCWPPWIPHLQSTPKPRAQVSLHRFRGRPVFRRLQLPSRPPAIERRVSTSAAEPQRKAPPSTKQVERVANLETAPAELAPTTGAGSSPQALVNSVGASR